MAKTKVGQLKELPLKDKLYIMQSFITILLLVGSGIMFFPKTFATNNRVNRLENATSARIGELETKVAKVDIETIVNQSILCQIAIEQKMDSAVQICTKQKIKRKNRGESNE